MFTPLSSAITKIVGLQLNNVIRCITRNYYGCDKSCHCYLAEKGYDPQFGARPVKRVIQRDVLNKLKEILAGTIATDSIILLDAFSELVLEIQD
jgi:ATP-dependent Clp protease ATP-binding subunit ClpB